MAYSPNRDPLLEIAKGNIPNHELLDKFGYNPDIDTTTDPEDIWDGGGKYDWATAAEAVDVTSSSANDTSAGTGARTIDIYGLDSSHNEISETITLNGTSNVRSVNSYLRLHRMIVRTAGTGGENAGNITATQATSAKLMAQIGATYNQTLMAIYTVPAGKTLYVREVYYCIVGGPATDAVVTMRARPDTEVFQTKFVATIMDTGNTSLLRRTGVPLVYAAKTDILLECNTVGANNTAMSGGFSGVLVS